MDKWQGLQTFWESFGIPAYDENSVPDDAVMPYITYHAEVAGFESVVTPYASVWYRSTSWAEISQLTEQIAEELSSCKLIPIGDNEYIFIGQGVPFAQRMNDPADGSIKRMYINIMVEYFTRH